MQSSFFKYHFNVFTVVKCTITLFHKVRELGKYEYKNREVYGHENYRKISYEHSE